MKTLKDLIKLFEILQGSVKIKISVNFYFCTRCWNALDGKGQSFYFMTLMLVLNVTKIILMILFIMITQFDTCWYLFTITIVNRDVEKFGKSKYNVQQTTRNVTGRISNISDSAMVKLKLTTYSTRTFENSCPENFLQYLKLH